MTRTILVLACLLLLAAVLFGMRRGWRNRLARQAVLPPLPTPPAELGAPLVRATGLYVGTTFATSWQDRVVHDGLGARAAAEAVLYASGLVLQRQGSPAIFVPAAASIQARLAPGLAGKVMGQGGLLVVRWRLGQAELDTAFRADDKSSYPEFVRTLNQMIRQDSRQ